MTARFRQENTEGYIDADLAALNAAFEEVMNANADLWANALMIGLDSSSTLRTRYRRKSPTSDELRTGDGGEKRENGDGRRF